MKIVGGVSAIVLFTIVILMMNIGLTIPAPVEQIVDRTNIPNAVTAVYLEARLFDTVFEIIVYSLTAMGVTMLLGSLPLRTDEPQQVFQTVTVFSGGLAAISITLFLYVVLNGHVSPGGGFSGGVILATGIVTYALTSDFRKATRHYDILRMRPLENASLILIFSVSTLVILFPEFHSSLLARGSFGATISGGLIPLLNLFIGIKVYAGAWKMASEFIHRRGTL